MVEGDNTRNLVCLFRKSSCCFFSWSVGMVNCSREKKKHENKIDFSLSRRKGSLFPPFETVKGQMFRTRRNMGCYLSLSLPPPLPLSPLPPMLFYYTCPLCSFSSFPLSFSLSLLLCADCKVTLYDYDSVVFPHTLVSVYPCPLK